MTTKTRKITKGLFVKHLNENSPPQGDGAWIIGGSIRMYHMHFKQYGKALREHDPVEFEIRYNEYCKTN